MKFKKESVAKGGGSIAIARILGMVFSFLLFLFLARQSAADAGIFRTAVTYILIAEFLGMLGLHRWLATEIAMEGKHQWPLFVATNFFTLCISCLLSAVYIAVSYSHLYSHELNQSILVSTLAVIPSGIYSCVQSALMGIGRNHAVGRLNFLENFSRSIISIGLVAMEFPVVYIVWVFVIMRWCVALAGWFMLKNILHGHDWKPQFALVRQVAREAPRFAMIIVAFLVLKNAAMVLLPALTSEVEAAEFAVAYQLFDLILVIPSVLAITSNNLFVSKANTSDGALRKVSTQLITLTSIALFPLIAITAGFAEYFLQFLYGQHYLASKACLMMLMLAAGLMMIDQVLSQMMLARKNYHHDMISISAGGVTAAILTVWLAYQAGAFGAAVALMIAIVMTICVRLFLLRNVFPLQLLVLSVWRPTLAATVVFSAILLVSHLDSFAFLADSKWQWMLFVPIFMILYTIIVSLLGGITLARRLRMKHFLFHR